MSEASDFERRVLIDLPDVDVLVVLVFDRLPPNVRTGVVDQDVQPVEAREDSPAIGSIRDIRREVRGLAARDANDGRAEPRQLFGDGQPDTSGRAGDKGRLPFERPG